MEGVSELLDGIRLTGRDPGKALDGLAHAVLDARYPRPSDVRAARADVRAGEARRLGRGGRTDRAPERSPGRRHGHRRGLWRPARDGVCQRELDHPAHGRPVPVGDPRVGEGRAGSIPRFVAPRKARLRRKRGVRLHRRGGALLPSLPSSRRGLRGRGERRKAPDVRGAGRAAAGLRAAQGRRGGRADLGSRPERRQSAARRRDPGRPAFSARTDEAVPGTSPPRPRS